MLISNNVIKKFYNNEIELPSLVNFNNLIEKSLLININYAKILKYFENYSIKKYMDI